MISLPTLGNRALTLAERVPGAQSVRAAPRSYYTGLILTIILGGAYMAFAQGTDSTTTTTAQYATVERRSIVTSVKAVGSVTFANEQQLKFNQKGTVTKVRVKEGDLVKKGQVLAELDKTSVNADIQQSALAVGASALQLEQLQADHAKQVTAAENTVRSADRTLAQSQADLIKTRDTELQSLASTAQDILISGQKLLDSFYSILTRDAMARPPNDDTTFEINRLLYRDWSIKSDVELAYRSAVNQALAMSQKYGTSLRTEKDPAVILTALQDARTLAETLQRLGERTYTLMQGASTDSITFTVDALNTLRGTVNTNRGTAAGLVDDALTAEANLASLSSPEGIPSVTLQAKQNTVISNEEAQQETRNDYQSTLADLDISIRLKQNDVGQKSAALTKLRKTLDDYQIVAPFDGTVRRVDYQVGDNLLADTTEAKYIVLENRDYTVITILLDQVDIIRVKIGQPASLTLDAIPGRAFSGAIMEIDPTPVQSSGVVSYNVSVRIPTPADLTILSGMTATVEIETSRKENVLAVPSLSLLWKNSAATLQRADGQTVPVETGLTDGRYTEILSGANEGESILAVHVAATGSASSAGVDPGQLMRLSGGFGGMPAGGGRTGTR